MQIPKELAVAGKCCSSGGPKKKSREKGKIYKKPTLKRTIAQEKTELYLFPQLAVVALAGDEEEMEERRREGVRFR